MPNEEHLDILKQGVAAWNRYRKENPGFPPDSIFMGTDIKWTTPDLEGTNLSQAKLSGVNLAEASLSRVNLNDADLNEANLSWADLSEADLMWANLSMANLSEANLNKANLFKAQLVGANLSDANLTEAILSIANLDSANLERADLSQAKLSGVNLNKANLNWADLSEADLMWANLSMADLSEANLHMSNLTGTNLSKANLTGADLTNTILVQTNLEGAMLANCRIYGISVWDLKLHGAKQSDLIISPEGEPTITVDNLEVAQFIYLLLHNEKIRQVIDTIISKVVLILGRFAAPRKEILDAVREELRKRNYLPILFDFDKPASRDMTETISTLAHLSRFVIADITDAKSIPQELECIVPNLPSVPVQPLLQSSADEYGMFGHFKRYPWVLEIHRYSDLNDLLKSLEQQIIAHVETKAKELQKKPS